MTRSARWFFAAVFLFNLLATTSAFAADPPGVDAKTAFAKLKSLAGEWKNEPGAGEHPGKITYRVTSNGSAVMETFFPGSDHEMISMYFVDGDELRMTHYCAMGNQPRLRLDRQASKPDELIFVFEGGTNLDPAKDMHIHGLRLSLRDKGHMVAEWESYEGGKSQGGMKFALTRP
jgi:hypothetical protein